jgi:hypothetical protein
MNAGSECVITQIEKFPFKSVIVFVISEYTENVSSISASQAAHVQINADDLSADNARLPSSFDEILKDPNSMPKNTNLLLLLSSKPQYKRVLVPFSNDRTLSISFSNLMNQLSPHVDTRVFDFPFLPSDSVQPLNTFGDTRTSKFSAVKESIRRDHLELTSLSKFTVERVYRVLL